MHDIAIMVEAGGHTPVPWDMPGTFPPGEFTLETLHRLASAMAGAIFIFAEDDRIWYRGDSSPQPRDNVLLEYGIFSGILGRRRAIICCCGHPKKPTDLNGLNYLTYDTALKSTFQRTLHNWLSDVGALPVAKQPDNVFSSSEDPLFLHEIQSRLLNAHRITMIGTGLDILGNLGIVDHMLSRCVSGVCTVDICMADPFSTDVETRLLEEERAEKRPWVKKRGLISRLHMLTSNWENAARPPSFKLRVFTHYPTFALIIVDNEYYIYPYAYSTLGNLSPVLRFSASNPRDASVVAFLDAHSKKIKSDALDGPTEYYARTRGVEEMSNLYGFAVYFVPDADSGLCVFGSHVIGYDVRNGKASTSPWSRYVGISQDYGLHLTIADCLYFGNKAEAEKATEQAKYLLSQTPPFELGLQSPRLGHPGVGTISIPVRDHSGRLALLHNEFVHRIYRRAVATDNTIGPGRFGVATRNGIELELLRRFGSPYVLNCYKPHFTLLRNLPSDSKSQTKLCEEIEKEFSTLVPVSSLRVRRIAIMCSSPSQRRWSIQEEVPLGDSDSR